MMSNISQNFSCDCGNTSVISLNYQPLGSEINANLYHCNDCETILSQRRTLLVKSRKKSISCDANWGNIRHGKGARLSQNISFFDKIISKQCLLDVLDIGSNRGYFVKWLINTHQCKNIYAVESDEIVYKETILPNKVKHINDRFENISFKNNKFTFIYNSHTLEHLDKPYSMLKKCYEILNNNGYMFLEVPNSEIVNDPLNLEEYFIDKHHYHFFPRGLKKQILKLGFEIVKESIDDVYNISFLLKKNKKINNEKKYFENINKKEKKYCIKSYANTLTNNRKKLEEVCAKINNLCARQKVAIWGCSRIFDASVKYGNLDTKNINYIIDNNISKILDESHGIKIYDNSILKEQDIDVVIVMARSSKKEIVESARSFGVRHVFTMEQF